MSRSIARSRAGILPGLLFALTLLCASHARAGEPVATFSIVGRDPATGEVGVAVQSKFFAVGAVVPWAKAGVGAIATQAFANTTFGPRGLELLAAGHTAQETLDRLLSDDPGREQRQVGIVDAEGGVASFTGTECNAWAGHVSGPDFTAQGNILVGDDGYTITAGAERLVIPKQGKHYDTARLAKQLRDIKVRQPSKNDLTVAVEDGIKYKFVIAAMDIALQQHFDAIRVTDASAAL